MTLEFGDYQAGYAYSLWISNSLEALQKNWPDFSAAATGLGGTFAARRYLQA